MPWPNKPIEFYLAALTDADSRVREEAAIALETLGDKRAAEPLLALLAQDTSKGVRAAAARAMIAVGGARAVEPLIQALWDSAPDVRMHAARALEALGDQRAAPFLFPLLDDPEPPVRHYATSAVGKLGDARAVAPLLQALRQTPVYGDPIVYTALGDVGEPARAPLLAALQDGDAAMRARAATALVHFNDDQTVEALTAASQDTDLTVRMAATVALKGISLARTFALMKERRAASQPMRPQRAPEPPAQGTISKASGDQARSFDWQGLMTQWNADLLADEEIRAELPPEIIAAGWMGYPGATEEQIAALEARLGAALPPSYRAFLAFSNGWRVTGHFIPAIWSTDEVEWYAVRKQYAIGAWLDSELPPVPDEEYLDYDEHGATSGAMRFEYYQTALEISDHEVAGTAVYLLNPQIVTPEGEWEAWFDAHWIPGAIRYRSFWEMMVAEHTGYLTLRDRQATEP